MFDHEKLGLLYKVVFDLAKTEHIEITPKIKKKTQNS